MNEIHRKEIRGAVESIYPADRVAPVPASDQPATLGNGRFETQLGRRVGRCRAPIGRRLAIHHQNRRQIRNNSTVHSVY